MNRDVGKQIAVVHQDADFAFGKCVHVGSDTGNHLHSELLGITFGFRLIRRCGTADSPVGAFAFLPLKLSYQQPPAKSACLFAGDGKVRLGPAEHAFWNRGNTGLAAIPDQHGPVRLDRLKSEVVIQSAVADAHLVPVLGPVPVSFHGHQHGAEHGWETRRGCNRSSHWPGWSWLQVAGSVTSDAGPLEDPRYAVNHVRRAKDKVRFLG